MPDVSKLRLDNISYDIKDDNARKYLVMVNENPVSATKVVVNSSTDVIELALQSDLNSAIAAEASARKAADNNFSTQISDIRSNIASEASTRAAADTAFSSQIASLQGAVGSPLKAATASAMTDKTKIYVYTGTETGKTAGHWYYWNGSAWVDGGVYNSSAINTDKTLSVSGMAADAEAVGDKIDLLKNVSTQSPNKLNHATDLVGYAFETNGTIFEYASHYISDYIEVEPGTEYAQLTFSGSSQVFNIRPTGVVCFYDENKHFLSSISRSSSAPTITPPANTKYLRLDAPFNDYRLIDMFGETSVMSLYYTSPELGSWAYMPCGSYSNPIDILRIDKPYVEKDWRGYWRIKFSKIWYVDIDNETHYLQYNSYITLKYPDLIMERSPARKEDTCLINDGNAFIYSYRKKQFHIVSVENIQYNDIIFFAVVDDIPYGKLFEAYNNSIEFFQSLSIYRTLPLEIMRSIDQTLENSGILAAESSDDVFSFVHVSDNHRIGAYMGVEVNLTGMAIKHLHSRANFDAIFSTGDDVLTGSQSVSGFGYNDGKVALSNTINSYPTDDLVYCEGNHDRGIIDEQYITHAEYFNLVLRHWKNNPNVHTSFPNSYYYRDYPDKKIRVVCLTLYNMSDNQEDTYPYNDYCGYDQIQMEWLCNTALAVDTGWSVIILVHSAPVTTAEGNTGNGTAGNNPLVLRSILESFMNGTSVHVTHTSSEAGGFFNIDLTTAFSEQGARPLIGVFSGHTHLDRIVPINNIYYDTICCGYVDNSEYSGNRGTRHANDISAVCFDIGLVNMTSKTVTLTRVGFVPTDNPVVTQVRSWTYH